MNTILGDIQKGVTTRSRVAHFCEHYSFVSSIEPHRVEEVLGLCFGVPKVSHEETASAEVVSKRWPKVPFHGASAF
jgi:hypothetical protein